MLGIAWASGNTIYIYLYLFFIFFFQTFYILESTMKVSAIHFTAV